MRSTTSSPRWADVLGTDPRAELADRLGHDFVDPALLTHALTHRSWCAEHAGSDSNERLEFLGDAVLGLLIADHLFAAHPSMPEGSLAKVRATIVSEAPLAAAATALGIGDALLLGRGEAASGGATKPSILSDALEAVFGAVYLDGGMEAARRVVLAVLGDRIEIAIADPGVGDHKSQLQEFAARQQMAVPAYEIGDEGPDHDKRFFARVLIDGAVVGEGEGRSKKGAEQAAAGAALTRLARIEPDTGKKDGGA